MQSDVIMADAEAWECFQDSSYYDMWCVRQVGDRTFGSGFHLMRGEEATALRDLLNQRADAQAVVALVEALKAARKAIQHRGGVLCSSRYYSASHCDCGAADAIAKIDTALAKHERN